MSTRVVDVKQLGPPIPVSLGADCTLRIGVTAASGKLVLVFDSDFGSAGRTLANDAGDVFQGDARHLTFDESTVEVPAAAGVERGPLVVPVMRIINRDVVLAVIPMFATQAVAEALGVLGARYVAVREAARGPIEWTDTRAA